MPSPTANPMLNAIDEMRAEHRRLMSQAGELHELIVAAERYSGTSRQAKRPIATSKNGHAAAKTSRPTPRAAVKTQPAPVHEGIVAVMREDSKGSWSAADLAASLIKRGALKAKSEQQARGKVRKALNGLRKKGVLVSKRDGQGTFAPTTWNLKS